MSFAQEVKNELLQIKDLSQEEMKSEIQAFIKLAGVVSIYDKKIIFTIRSKRAYMLRRVKWLINNLYETGSDILVYEENSFGDKKTLELFVFEGKMILEDLKLIPSGGLPLIQSSFEFIKDNKELMRSYLR